MCKKWWSSSIAPLVAVALSVGLAASAVQAGGGDDGSESKLSFPEAELYFELNDTDKDLGIHSSIDGQIWTRLEIESPSERRLLAIRASGPLRGQGLTQLFFESAEPNFEEQSPSTFFSRFPAGEYEVSGTSIDGEEIENSVTVSQVLPDRVRNVTVGGLPAAESCDADALPEVDGNSPVIVRWNAVTSHHPEVGTAGPVMIVRYEFFVERPGVKLGVTLPPDVTEFQVPREILALGDEFKFEIIARGETGNNTAIESCFVLE